MNKTHQKYYDALKHIISENNKKPTKSSVAYKAGMDRSSIKPGRSEWMDKLIKDIDNAEQRYIDNKKNPETQLKEKEAILKTENIDLKDKLNKSYEKQLHLIKKVRELEKNVQDLNNRKSTLEDFSANISDYTKVKN